MPAPPPKTSLPTTADAPGLLAALRQFALVGAGLAPNNRLDGFIRRRDLVDAGIIQISESAAGGAGAGTGGTGPGGRPVVVEPARDLTPPPPPGGFAATAGVTQILFETAAPVYRQGHGHARTKVYAAPAIPPPTFADAVLYTDFPGNIGVAPFDPASSLRLWATWTSVDGIESEPAGGTNGVAAATGLLEDVHIANLAVGKLLAGSLAVGQYIQSADYVAGVTGWRIQTLGGGGAFFECRGNAVFGGTIYASAGLIGGSTIGSNYIRSNNYILGTQGWQFKDDGTGQIGAFTVGNTYIQSNTYTGGSVGWRLNSDGTGQIGGFVVSADDIHSNNFLSGSDGWRIKQDGAAEFSDVHVRRLLDLYSGELIPSVAVTSWQGDIAETGEDPDLDGTYDPLPYTNTYMRLYGASFHSGVPFNQRARYAPDATYPVTLTVYVGGISDAAISLWVRYTGTSWSRLQTSESAGIGGDGFVSVYFSLDTIMSGIDYVDFGLTATLADDSFVDSTKRYVNAANIVITCVNV